MRRNCFQEIWHVVVDIIFFKYWVVISPLSVKKKRLDRADSFSFMEKDEFLGSPLKLIKSNDQIMQQTDILLFLSCGPLFFRIAAAGENVICRKLRRKEWTKHELCSGAAAVQKDLFSSLVIRRLPSINN